MQFGLNYSPAAAELIRSGAITVDTFKCPEWPALIEPLAAWHACYPHFAFRLGRAPFAKTDWTAVKHLLELTGAPHVNAHLAPSIVDFPGMTLTDSNTRLLSAAIDTIARDARELLSHFQREKVVLENVMWDPDAPWEIPEVALRTDVITRIVREHDCGFLLDLSHARISALHFGEDECAYIERLPLERLRELHISGVRLGVDGLWNDHHPMSEDDWSLLAWALERIRKGNWPEPAIVTFEYGGVGPGYEDRTDRAMLSAAKHLRP